jgi:AraC-like DNA-binding protein
MASRDGSPQETLARQALGVLLELSSEQVFDFAAFRVGAGAVKHMWSRLMAETGDPALGLHCGEAMGPMSNAVHSWAWTCRDPLLALELIAEHWKIASPISQVEYLTANELVGMRYSMRHGLEPLPADFEYRLVCWVTVMRWMVSPEVNPVRAEFPFSPPRYLSEFHRIFRCPLEWDRPAGEVWFRKTDLAKRKDLTPQLAFSPPPNAAPASEPRNPQDGTFVQKVKGIVQSSLSRGEFGADQVARRLGLSERTLLRKLQQHGVSYRNLLEGIRRNSAAGLIKDQSMTLREIAIALGYSNLQNFARAYRRWHGSSPRRHRNGRSRSKLPGGML